MTNELLAELKTAYTHPLGADDWHTDADNASIDAWTEQERINPATGQRWTAYFASWEEIPNGHLAKLIAHAPTYWQQIQAIRDAEAAEQAARADAPAAHHLAQLEEQIRAGANVPPEQYAQAKLNADAEAQTQKLQAEGAKQLAAAAKARDKRIAATLDKARAELPQIPPELADQINAAMNAITAVHATIDAYDQQLAKVRQILAGGDVVQRKAFMSEGERALMDPANTYDHGGRITIDGQDYKPLNHDKSVALALHALRNVEIPKNNRAHWS